MKSGNLNFLEPSGPLQACNGTALPLLTPIKNYRKFRVPTKHGVDHLIFQCERLKNKRDILKKSVIKKDNWPLSKSELMYRNFIHFIRYKVAQI